MVHVKLTDGCCRDCGGELQVTDADEDEAMMQVVCEACGDEYSVEHDAFGDRGIEYWSAIMAELEAAE
jgi:hypothetical protein